MALIKVFDTVLNRGTGVPIEGATVRLFYAGTSQSSQAPIYADELGAALPTPNETQTDADGLFQFFADTGSKYDMVFYVGSTVYRIITDVTIAAGGGGTGAANSTYQTTAELEAALVSNVSAILAETGKAGTFTIRNYADFTAQVAADPGKVNFVRSTSDTTKVWVRTTILDFGASQVGTASGANVQDELDEKLSVGALVPPAGPWEFVATAGQTAFVASGSNAYDITVKVNDQTLVLTDDYTRLGDTTTLIAPASEGDDVVLSVTQAVENLAGVVVSAPVVRATGPSGAVSNVQAYLDALKGRQIDARDFGAVGDGSTDDSAALQAAIDSGANEIHFIDGEYLIDTEPTGYSQLVQLVVHPSASLTGSGASISLGFGYYPKGQTQILQLNTDSDTFATQYWRQYNNYSGGVAGYASRVIGADMVVGPDATDYNWAGVFAVLNYADAGQNVGIYGQGRMLATGATWGGTLEAVDMTGTDSTGKGELVGAEVDCYFNGEDVSSTRTGLLVVAGDAIGGKTGVAGTPGSATYGIRIVNQQGFAACKFKVGVMDFAATVASFQAGSTGTYAFRVTGNYTYGLDFIDSTISTAAVSMKQDQPITWLNDRSRKLTHNGSGFNFLVGSTVKFRVSDTGAFQSEAVTYAQLPASPALGMMATITDCTTGTAGATAAGGGSTKALIWHSGTNWKVVVA